MPQIKILLDTNTYLRLAKSIHPLLGIEFGKEKFTLYIHKEIEIELNRSSRLQNKFNWMEQDEYRQNRKKKLIIKKSKQEEIENTYDYIWEYQKEQKLNLSREDIYCIATALELGTKLVTDDQNMIEVCNEFEVNVFSTLELMKLMFDNNHIDLNKISEITEYWKYENDLPANFQKDFKKFFK
ncbi:hypothetical protein BMS3Abin04_01328 [bacterium BMS3Abin04]|nr:hypothetical protein BMS3Abin04_01328 [bacterium BMS3Abin04]